MKRVIKLLAVFLAVLTCLSSLTVLTPVAVVDGKSDVIKIHNTKTGIYIKWSKVKGVKKYTLYRWDGKEDSTWEKYKTVSGTSFTDKNLESGCKYAYAINIGGNFGVIKSYVYLNSPVISSANGTALGIKVKWNNVKGADGYIIYRKTADGKFKKVGEVSGAKKTSFTDTKAKEGVEYFYAVCGVRDETKEATCGAVCKSEISEASAAAAYVGTIKITTVKNSPKGVTISWTGANNLGVEVYRKIESGDWKKAGTAAEKSTLFIDKKASYSKTNTYKIRAVKGESKGTFSKPLSVLALNPSQKAVALTWDDGPYTPVTNQILDTLEKNNARATFFIVGSRVEAYKDCIRREVNLGCEVATHTNNHTILTSVSAAKIKKEVSDSVKAIEKYAGKGAVKVMRAPGGAVNSTVSANVPYPLINWSVDTLDWQHRTTAKTVANIKANVKDGSIVLMHDLYVATGNAAVEIIPWLKAQGYQLVTVSELFELKGITPKAGQLYTHG